MATKILGICGSPRRNANTENLLDVALDGARSVDDVEVEKISLARLDLHGCTGCRGCDAENFDQIVSKSKEFTGDETCVQKMDGRHKDDIHNILLKMYEADGIIFASPVYYANVSGEMKLLMDRTQPLLRYAGTKYKCGLGNKVGGGVVSAYNRNGGAETTLDAIHHFMFIHDMIIVGSGLVFMDGHITAPGCYFGGAGITWNTVGDFSKEVGSKDVVLKDELGVRNTRSLGLRVAEVAKSIANVLPVREDLVAQIKKTTKVT